MGRAGQPRLWCLGRCPHHESESPLLGQSAGWFNGNITILNGLIMVNHD